MPLKEETIGVIMNRLARARSMCKPWHDSIIRRRRMYKFLHYIKAAKANETQYPDPTPTNVVDVGIGVLGSHPLEWRATGWSPSFAEQKETSKVEKFIIGALDQANEREEKYLPYYAHMHFCRDGAAVIRSVWDPILASEVETTIPMANPGGMPEMGNMTVPMRAFWELPMATEVVDPLEMFMIKGGRKRWLHVFRVTKMSVFDAETLYNFKSNRYVGTTEAAKMEMQASLIDYWRIKPVAEPILDEIGQMVGTKTKQAVVNCVVFENEFIPGFEPQIMDGYEDIPFTIGFFKPVDDTDPRHWGHSLIDPLEPTVRLLERNINRTQMQIDVFSALPMVIKALPGRTVQVDPGFGRSLTIGTEEEIAFPLWPGNPPDVYQQRDYLRSRLQQSGFTDILFGMGGQGAGYAMSQMADQNRIRLIEPIKHIETFWSAWAKKVLKLTKNFAGNSVVRVTGTLKGQDFVDQIIGNEIAEYRVAARLKAEFPNQKLQNAAMSTQSADVLSLSTRMERFWDIEQPDDEIERKIMDQARQHPLMQQYGVLTALMELANTGDEAAMMVIQTMQQQQQPQQPGAAEAPTVSPEQLTGTAGPTGQMPPQAAGGAPPGQSPLETMERLTQLAPTMGGGLNA